MALNNVNLVGRPTTDPELAYLQEGTAVARFTLAVARDYKDNDGNRPADFIRCVIWGNQEQSNRATIFVDYTRQGDLVDIAGRIETRSFEGQDGEMVYMTEVNIRDYHFLAQKKEDNQQQQQPQNNRNQNNRNQNNNQGTKQQTNRNNSRQQNKPSNNRNR